MVLHNNYYIDETEKINFFRYENLENFDLASSITEKIQFNNDLLLKLENAESDDEKLNLYSQISTIYKDLANHQKALYYLEKMLDIKINLKQSN